MPSDGSSTIPRSTSWPRHSMPLPAPTITGSCGRRRSTGRRPYRRSGPAPRRRNPPVFGRTLPRSASEPRPRRARIDARAWQRDARRLEARAGHDDVDEAVVVPHDHGERAAERIFPVQLLEVDAAHLETHGIERIVRVVMHPERADPTAPGGKTVVREEPSAVRRVQRTRAHEKAVVAERDQDGLPIGIHAVRVRIRDEGPTADHQGPGTGLPVHPPNGGNELEDTVEHGLDRRGLYLGEGVAAAPDDERDHDTCDPSERHHTSHPQCRTGSAVASHSDPAAAPGTASKYHPASAQTSSSGVGPATRLAPTHSPVKVRPRYFGSLAGQSADIGPAKKHGLAGLP